jgi:hypothetical protein
LTPPCHVNDTADIRKASPFFWVFDVTLAYPAVFRRFYPLQDRRFAFVLLDVLNNVRFSVFKAIAQEQAHMISPCIY